ELRVPLRTEHYERQVLLRFEKAHYVARLFEQQFAVAAERRRIALAGFRERHIDHRHALGREVFDRDVVERAVSGSRDTDLAGSRLCHLDQLLVAGALAALW